MSRLFVVLVLLAIAPAAFAQSPVPLLVDTAWLTQHINDRNLVVLHVDGEPEYKSGHIPGARFVTMQQVSRAPGPDNPLVLELAYSHDLRKALHAEIDKDLVAMPLHEIEKHL
jgi:3-mercaptopyruvate sulfurtransferase SseA